MGNLPALRALALTTLTGLLAWSCDLPHSSADGGAPLTKVTVAFAFAVNGQPFSCTETYQGVGVSTDAGTAFRGSFARFYVYGVSLTTPEGASVPLALVNDGPWQLADAGVALIDGENGGSCAGASGNLSVVGQVPQGTYTGLRFVVGLPNDLNHLRVDFQPSPLNQSEMFWTWTRGYRFLRIEGQGLLGACLHLGSTGCVLNDAVDVGKGATCEFENTIPVEFPAFDTSANRVVVDIGHLFQGNDIAVNKSGPAAPGCMSDLIDADCPPMFKALGLPYADGVLADGGLRVVTPSEGQTVFLKE